MRTLACLLVLALAQFFALRTPAQEKPNSTEPAKASSNAELKTETEKPVVPLKVTIVFNEYDGDKKVSSLPYALFLKAVDEHHPYFGRVRMGVRVPIASGKDGQLQYQDVGSNIDCEALALEGGRFLLDLMVERSSIYPNFADNEAHSAEPRGDGQAHEPMIRTFRANQALILRDGQSTQATVATDPLNGHIVKVDVTLNVLK